MDSRLFLLVVVTDIRSFSSIGIPFNAHVISNGVSPLTTVQTAETESPQFTALSAISKGAMRGGTVKIIEKLLHTEPETGRRK